MSKRVSEKSWGRLSSLPGQTGKSAPRPPFQSSSKQELLDRLAEERRKLYQAIEGLTEEEMTRPGVVGGWSVKDVLAHLGSWEEEGARRLALIAEGQEGEIVYYNAETIQQRNEQVWTERRGWPLSRVMARLTSARRELVAAVSELTEDDLDVGQVAVRTWLPNFSFEHDGKHAAELLAWRDGGRTE